MLKYIVTFFIIFISISNIFARSFIVCTGNSVNIRKEQKIESNNIIAKANMGELIEVVNYPDFWSIRKNPKDVWVKCFYNNSDAWINYFYTSMTYFYNKEKKIITWAKYLREDDFYQIFELCSYDLVKKKTINSIETDYTRAIFSNKGSYVVVDVGTDIIRSIIIYEIPELKKIYEFKVVSADDTNFEFDKSDNLFFYQYKEFEEKGVNKLLLTEYVFRNGEVGKTGKSKIVNSP